MLAGAFGVSLATVRRAPRDPNTLYQGLLSELQDAGWCSGRALPCVRAASPTRPLLPTRTALPLAIGRRERQSLTACNAKFRVFLWLLSAGVRKTCKTSRIGYKSVTTRKFDPTTRMATPGTQRLQGVAVGTDYCTQTTHTNTRRAPPPPNGAKRRTRAMNDLDARIYRNAQRTTESAKVIVK